MGDFDHWLSGCGDTIPNHLRSVSTAQESVRQGRHSNSVQHMRYAAAKLQHQGVERFIGGAMSTDEKLRRDLERVRAASRNAGDDIGYVKRYLGMVQTHVVGENGLRLQAMVRNRDGSLNTDANKILETEFAEWGELGTCELTGRLSWIGGQELSAKTTAQDGDVLVRYHVDKSNPYGFSFELLPADFLDVNLTQNLRNGNRIRMGVELNPRGQHVAYHLLTSHPGDSTWVTSGRRYVRIPADEMDLLYHIWEPGQNRGLPWAHASLLEMHQIGGYRESQLVAARIGASNMAFYERDPDLEAADDFNADGDFIMELEAGQASVVPEGYKVTQTNFAPPSGMADFQKAALRGSAAGMDVNYNTLGNDYEGVSYSSMRQAVLDDREGWKRKQRWLIENLASKIYRRWLRTALLKSALPGLNASDLQQLSKHKFQGRRWQWVDPLKDEQAIGAAIKNGTADPMRVLSEKGLDLDELAEGYGAWLDRMEPLLQRFNAMLGSAAPAKQQNPKDDEE
jgi:lambda family phage portal protein